MPVSLLRHFFTPFCRNCLKTAAISWVAAIILVLAMASPLRAFDWETATSNGREYVSLRSFCSFYGMGYSSPSGNDRFTARNSNHSISFKIGSSDAYIDGVHYVLSFPVEGGDHDWLVSRMDVIKLFEPIMRPTEVSGRHTIRGVVIDAGHGGSDNGATSRYGNEKTYTMDTANRLAKILNDAGLKTVFTRRTDVFVDLYERAHIASLYSDYAFVSLHYNSASAEARGLETYCLSPRGAASTSSRYLTRGDIQKLPGNSYDTQNILLASLVHSEIVKLNPGDSSTDRGVKRARFVVIKQNVLPAILVEGGFLSNRMEAARVNQPQYRQSLAQAVARGVIKFANLMGDRHMSLSSSSDTPPAATPAPANPPAPAGMAKDSGNGTVKTPAPKTSADKTQAASTGKNTSAAKSTTTAKNTATTSAKSKKDKTKTSNVPTPELSKPPVSGPAPETNAPAKTEPSKPLNLTEPAAPTPSPGSEKAPPEPDEPPTVSTTPPGAKSGSAPSSPEKEP